MDSEELSALLPFVNGGKYPSYVVASDRLKKIPLHKLPVQIIFNADPSYRKGSHWMSLLVVKIKNKISSIYFDSANYDLENYNIKLKFPHVKFSSYATQQNSTRSCGLFCLYTLYRLYLNNNVSFNKIYSKNVKKNELLVRKFYQKISSKKCKFICKNLECNQMCKKRSEIKIKKM